MLKQLFDPGNLPFLVALGIMIGLGLIEIAALLIGFDLFPDSDADVDVDLDVDADAPEGLLAWFGIGSMPLLVVLVLFLTMYGLVGLGVRMIYPLSAWQASVPALIVATVVARSVSRAMGNAIKKNETTAVAADSLVGHTATITLGAARRGAPSQAKLRDKHGQTHYVLVEPMRDEDEFASGSSVILVERAGPKFFVVDDRPESLFELDRQVRPIELSEEHHPKA